MDSDEHRTEQKVKLAYYTNITQTLPLIQNDKLHPQRKIQGEKNTEKISQHISDQVTLIYILVITYIA